MLIASDELQVWCVEERIVTDALTMCRDLLMPRFAADVQFSLAGDYEKHFILAVLGWACVLNETLR